MSGLRTATMPGMNTEIKSLGTAALYRMFAWLSPSFLIGGGVRDHDTLQGWSVRSLPMAPAEWMSTRSAMRIGPPQRRISKH
jgi:hypothetical protein